MPRSFLIKKHFGCPLKKRLLLATVGNRQPIKDPVPFNDRLQPEDLRSSPRSPPEASGPELPAAMPVSTPPPGVTLIARSADDPKSMLLGGPLTVSPASGGGATTWSSKNVIPPYLPFSFAALYPAAFPQQGTDYYSNSHPHQHPHHPHYPHQARLVPPLYPTSSPPPLRTAALPDPDVSPYTQSRIANDSAVRPKTAPLAPLPVDAAGKNSNANNNNTHSPGNGISNGNSPFLYHTHHQMWEEKPARENKECSSDGDSDHSSMKKRREAPRYQCSDCNKSYSTFSGLTKHQQFHCVTQTKRTFSCKYCEKVYVSLGALKMHIRTHTLPCKCKLCGKAFSRPWLLQGHIRTHTGEKPFACQHCSRAFADRSNLRAHLQTHSDVKKYSCKNCSKTFSRMSLLTKHEDGGCSCPQI